ncbi:MAG: hypothetical protein U0R26_05590 [Solirubrobacterales bacterium]
MGEGAADGAIETAAPSRPDRLPWSRFHGMAVIGLDGPDPRFRRRPGFEIGAAPGIGILSIVRR